MNIELHPHFKKVYKIRINKDKKLVRQMTKRLALFQNNQHHPLLRDHALTGSKRAFRAFSVTGDVRIVYLQLSQDHILLLDIGTHNQVY